MSFKKWWYDQENGAPTKVFNSDEEMAKAAYKQALLEVEEVADDVDEVEGYGYYAQLGDARKTKANIIAAIRKMAEEA